MSVSLYPLPLSCWINLDALPTSNFQPIRLLDPGCWYKFFRSQLIWIYTVCKGRVYPGSAGQGLRLFHPKYKTFFFFDRNEVGLPEPPSQQVQPKQKKGDPGCAEQVVERLNLSNLSGDKSDTDTFPFKSTPHADFDVEQTYNIFPGTNNLVMGTSGDREKHVAVPPNLPNKPINVPKLLTPADFMSKQVAVHVPDTDLINKEEIRDYHIHSESQSVASTPRVLCQSAEHSHPLYETHTLTLGKAIRGATATCSREITPRSVKGEDSWPASEQDVQKEIIQIRNRLKNFDQKKKKLRYSYLIISDKCSYFSIKACCGYSWEVPHQGTSHEYPQHIVLEKWEFFFIIIFWLKKCLI